MYNIKIMEEKENDYVYLLTEGTLNNGTNYGIVKYVGVTNNPERRRKEHKRKKPPHEFHIITMVQDGTLAGQIEQEYVSFFETDKGSGWNKTKGGDKRLSGVMHPMYIDGRSKDWKAYMREYNKEYKNIPENKDKIKEYNEEYRNIPENKAKAQEYKKEWSQTPKGKKKKSIASRKYILSKKGKEKKIISNIKYTLSKKGKKRRSIANRKYILSKTHPILDIYSGAIL